MINLISRLQAFSVQRISPIWQVGLLGVFLLLIPSLGHAQLIQTIEKIKPSVVGIGTFQKTRSPAVNYVGTGFVVDDGHHVVTNAHVVPDTLDIQKMESYVVITGTGQNPEIRSATIVALDKELDRLRSLRPKLDEHQRQVKADEANYLNYLAKVGNSPPTDYQVQVGDQLDIKFFFNSELNESILVRPDGRIALQLVGEISVIGLTVEQIREILIENYAGQLKNPEIAVLLRTSHVLTGDFRPSPQ